VTATTLGIVGAGWRSEFFVRLAALLPDQLTLVGAAVRRPEVADDVSTRWKVPAYLSPDDLVSGARPDLVISSVPWAAGPDVIRTLVRAGVRVLSETPPAPDVGGLATLWDDVGASRRVHVAEQYLLLPGHAARHELLRRGTIGRPTSVQVSSTHTYHAISMIRGLLGVGFAPTRVRAERFTAPLVDPLTRDGWTRDSAAKPADTLLATFDFGDGRSGLYDFTDNQWHNQLRHRRIVIRGSHGEIVDDDVIRLADETTIVRSPILRSQLGYDLNLDGYDTEHLTYEGSVVYRNAFLGHRLMDEEIAIATVLQSAARWAQDDGPGPYPLAQACEDHLLGLAIDDALAAGIAVDAPTGPWAR
jgi:predicted dehydrogenase